MYRHFPASRGTEGVVGSIKMINIGCSFAASFGFTHLLNLMLFISSISWQEFSQYCLYLLAIASSHPSLFSIHPSSLIEIFALTVNGPAKSSGSESYSLVIELFFCLVADIIMSLRFVFSWGRSLEGAFYIQIRLELGSIELPIHFS